MTPISAIASVPPGAPGLDPGAGRAARQAAPETAPAADASGSERSFWDRLWGEEGFSFGALLDVINPLQHIPVVSTIYRAASGDTIGPAPRVMGGAIFGGVIGLITSAADAVVEGVTGKDTGSHILAMLPEPDPDTNSIPQWAENEDPRHRALMTAVLNLPNESPTQFAADSAPEKSAAESTAAVSSAARASMAQTTRESATAQATTAQATTTQAAHDAKPSPAAALQNPVAVIPAAARSFAPASTQPFAAPARTAQSGAGGRPVPLANNGRPIVNLPSPKELAANPALLQELRQGGAAAANAAQKNTGRIDTAIKGHGLVTPAVAKPEPIVTPAAFDARADDSRASDAAPQTTMNAAPGAMTAAPGATKPAPTKAAPATRDPSTMPEVGPDFLMKMQQALEKYQQMRAAPSLDVSH